jgi:opacity protein-like surface antigen
VTSNSDSQATMKITDFGSLRIRGGYTMGSFLPYLSAGVALARADVDRNVAVRYSLTQNGTTTGPFTLPPVVDSTKQFLYGFTLGAGLDWMLFNGLFLRTEYEYLQFTSSINTNIHTVRAGVGYKF